METKDYYKILGISEEEKKLKGEEFTNLVNKKYKKLALRFHPDRHVNDSESEKKANEDKFKEINEAHAILSDTNKREQYDNGGVDFSDFLKKHFGEGGGSPFGSFFRNFGFGFGGNPFGSGMDINKGDDVHVQVNISLEEAYRGTTKTVTYNKMVVCEKCNGTGSQDGKTHECPHCHGTGRIVQSRQSGGVLMQNVSMCPYCHGTGSEITAKCTSCGGTGLKKQLVTEKIDIPRGIANGMSFKIEGIGSEAPGENSIDGDLIVTVSVSSNGYFNLVDNVNIVHYDEVNFADAMLGFTKKYKTIDGGEVEVRVPECTPDNKAFFFNGKGMPDVYGRGYGDYAIVIKYKYPHSLNEKQKEALKLFK